MRQLFVIYDVSVDDEIRALLEENGVRFYTRFPRCGGRGPRTGAREDDHIWPGYNVMILSVLENEIADRTLLSLQRYRDDPRHKNVGLFAYCTHVDTILNPQPGANPLHCDS